MKGKYLMTAKLQDKSLLIEPELSLSDSRTSGAATYDLANSCKTKLVTEHDAACYGVIHTEI